MLEVAVVLDLAYQPLWWHVPDGASATALPDSRELWEVLWAQRGRLLGVAHLHPGAGAPVPSSTDLGTFAACEDGLGMRLQWWIATSDQVRCFDWIGPMRYDFRWREARSADETAAWLEALRARSHRRST
jgi:hypothetical protein